MTYDKMKRFKCAVLVFILVCVTGLTGCTTDGRDVAGRDDDGQGSDVPGVMEFVRNSDLSEREQMLAEAKGDDYTDFFRYRADKDVKSVSFYILEPDEDGGWKEEEMLKQDMVFDENQFAIMADVEKPEITIASKDEDGVFSEIYEPDFDKEWEAAGRKKCDNKVKIRKDRMIPVAFLWNRDSKGAGLTVRCANTDEKYDLEYVYEHPEEIEEVYGDAFIIGVKFR